MNYFRQIKKSIINNVTYKLIKIGNNQFKRRRTLPNHLAKTSTHESFLDDIYRSILGIKNGSFIDVGVNTGQTLLKLLSIDENRPYVGFEPQISAASSVEAFLIENKLVHHRILAVALSDHDGAIPLNVRGEGYFSLASTVSSIVKGFRPDGFYNYTKYIHAIRGDELIKALGIDDISIIKIDVEGAELEVIRGLTDTIKKYRPFILFEVLHHYLVVTKEELDKKTVTFREARIRELEQTIRSNNYLIFQIIGKGEIREIGEIRPKAINDLNTTDYLAVPVEKNGEFCSSIKTGRHLVIN